MYYNNITRNVTEHSHRFKTNDEFVEEFGDGYNNDESEEFVGWYPHMDIYFGEDLPLDYETYFDEESGCYFLGEDGMIIEDCFLVENETKIDYNKPTKLVYEKKILSFEKFINK